MVMVPSFVWPAPILHLEQADCRKILRGSGEIEPGGYKAWAKVSKMVGSEARFEVKTENAVAGVRGTVFRVNVEEDAATVVKVYEGAVVVQQSIFQCGQEKAHEKGTRRLQGA